jgi:hypothetical protein
MLQILWALHAIRGFRMLYAPTFSNCSKGNQRPFASCKKVFDYRVQYHPFIMQTFYTNFVPGGQIPFCKL